MTHISKSILPSYGWFSRGTVTYVLVLIIPDLNMDGHIYTCTCRYSSKYTMSNHIWSFQGCTATSRVQSAVNWLSRCVLQFYHPTPDEGGAPDLRESLLLYRLVVFPGRGGGGGTTTSQMTVVLLTSGRVCYCTG